MSMDRDTQGIIEADNPWLSDGERLSSWLRSRLPGKYVPRRATEGAHARWAETGRAHLVVGPRRAGKSTAIWHYLSNQQEPVLFIDCEQPGIQSWCRSAPLFLKDLEELVATPVVLFFEEAQHLEEAGLFIKGLVDRVPKASILVTGSSAFHLQSRTRESLAGRATRTRLLPFSLAELLWDMGDRPKAIHRRLLEERFGRHSIVGGYPDVWLSETPEIELTDLVEAIILRDASDLFRIGRPDAFRRVLRLAATQAGNLVNVSEWSSIVGVSRDTVASYLEILESSHVVTLVRPFVGGRRAEITSTPKVFLVDNGIRSRLLHDFKLLDERVDKGATLENWVFTELWKELPEGASLHFWRSASGAEVDFVITRGDTIVGIEVKSERLRRASIPRAARSFLRAYEPKQLWLVNMGFESREQIGVTDVFWTAPTDVAARVGEAFG
ncbi:MAG: ATP-binding protein [Acidobacteriota bacterium]|nr:MAG: ATP-binding protein [Acidobacteriota bacterium]